MERLKFRKVTEKPCLESQDPPLGMGGGRWGNEGKKKVVFIENTTMLDYMLYALNNAIIEFSHSSEVGVITPISPRRIVKLGETC